MSMVVNNIDTEKDRGDAVPASTLPASSITTDNASNSLEGRTQSETNDNIATRLDSLAQSVGQSTGGESGTDSTPQSTTSLMNIKQLGGQDEAIELGALNVGAGQFTYTVPAGAEVGSWFEFVLDAQVGWPNNVMVKFQDGEPYLGNSGGTFKTRERYTRTRFVKIANGWI